MLSIIANLPRNVNIICAYVPVAQLDSALDSDVSGRSGSDMAGSVENTGLADFPVKKSASVDYYLTTILIKQTTAERR